MTVSKIFQFLDKQYPCDTACDFDNVGLLIGDGEQEVTKALVSLDCTMQTIAEAKEKRLPAYNHPPPCYFQSS